MWGVHYGFDLMGIPIVPGGVDTATRAGFVDRYDVTMLAATPSYLLFLANTMRELGLDPAASTVTRVITGGEPVPQTTQDRIAEAWGCEVHQFYGCTEAAGSAGGYTCGAGPWLHCMDDTHVLETVDRRDAAAGTGRRARTERDHEPVLGLVAADPVPRRRLHDD